MSSAKDSFARALLDPILLPPDGLTDGVAQPAGRRFDVYRNNIAVSLKEALLTGFPVVTKIIGTQNMAVLANAFVRAHPPCDPLMMLYGAEFPDYLEAAPQLAHLGYLPDIARLELAIRQAYHAGDACAIAPDQLAQVPAQALNGVSFTFAPAVRLLRSDWPIFDIWQFNTNDNAIKPQPGAQVILVTRPEFDPVVQLLARGGSDWIGMLMQGHSIGDALEMVLTKTPEFDMTAPLTLLLQGGALISLTTKDSR